MKEKTFEELITEKFPNYMFADKHDWNMRKFSATDMIEMMNQVREATIAECRKIALYEDDSVLIWDHIKKMPTDRIIITP